MFPRFDGVLPEHPLTGQRDRSPIDTFALPSLDWAVQPDERTGTTVMPTGFNAIKASLMC